MEVLRLVSGGQAGPDRAALDVAALLDVPYGGWCPRGGWAEDLVQPPGLRARYPLLRETSSSDPAERTRLNVRDSDATLVVAPGEVDSPGTDRTVAIARELGRPLLMALDPSQVRSWLEDLDGAGVLNVAGPRASEWPEGYDVAHALLVAVIG